MHLSAREWKHHPLAGFPSFDGVVGARPLHRYGLGVVVGVVDIVVVRSKTPGRMDGNMRTAQGLTEAVS